MKSLFNQHGEGDQSRVIHYIGSKSSVRLRFLRFLRRIRLDGVSKTGDRLRVHRVRRSATKAPNTGELTTRYWSAWLTWGENSTCPLPLRCLSWTWNWSCLSIASKRQGSRLVGWGQPSLQPRTAEHFASLRRFVSILALLSAYLPSKNLAESSHII